MHSARVTTFLCASIFAVGSIQFAHAASLDVPGTANIYGAGHAVPPAPDNNGAGTLPPVYSFAAAPGHVLTFSSVTGQVSCCVTAFNGPDGGSFASGNTNITAFGGVSGTINDDRTMFLVGVFSNNSEPANPPPPTLDFTGNEGFSQISPALNQVFFVGDGLTGTGTGSTQQFNAPATATRLFLGFADALEFGNPISPPGSYNDNTGMLRAQFHITGVPDVPEPSSWALLALGLCALPCLSRRKTRGSPD